jgi:hypothetical protein
MKPAIGIGLAAVRRKPNRTAIRPADDARWSIRLANFFAGKPCDHTCRPIPNA